MSFDVNPHSHLFLDFEEFLNLFKPVHLPGIKLMAMPAVSNRIQIGSTLLGVETIQEARLAIWNWFGEFLSTLDHRWISPEDYCEAQFIQDIAELVVPLCIVFVGNPQKREYGYVSWDLDDKLQIAFECEDLFETVMTPKGQVIGKILSQAGVLDDSSIAPTNWASGG